MPDTTNGAAQGSMSPLRPAVIVHGLAHARAATAAAGARGVLILSAPGAGSYAGAGWFAALARQAGAAHAVLDCGPDGGAVLAAFRAGLRAAVFTGDAAMATRLDKVAAEAGGTVLRAAPPALDLAGWRPTPWWQARLAAHLAGTGG